MNPIRASGGEILRKVLVNAHYEKHAEQLIELAARFAAALSKAGIEYRIVGGLAIYLHVNSIDPIAARLTRDIDATVRRSDIERIAEAVKPFGLESRHAAGVDMLVDAGDPKARSAVHLVLVGEKGRPNEVESVPEFSTALNLEGLVVAPVADLVRMKLTSFRLKDQVHIQDMDGVGLITPEMEAQLPELLRATRPGSRYRVILRTRLPESRNSRARCRRAGYSAAPCKCPRAPD